MAIKHYDVGPLCSIKFRHSFAKSFTVTRNDTIGQYQGCARIRGCTKFELKYRLCFGNTLCIVIIWESGKQWRSFLVASIVSMLTHCLEFCVTIVLYYL